MRLNEWHFLLLSIKKQKDKKYRFMRFASIGVFESISWRCLLAFVAANRFLRAHKALPSSLYIRSAIEINSSLIYTRRISSIFNNWRSLTHLNPQRVQIRKHFADRRAFRHAGIHKIDARNRKFLGVCAPRSKSLQRRRRVYALEQLNAAASRRLFGVF